VFLRAIDVPAKQFVELRTVFPRSLLRSTAGAQVRDGNAFGRIVAEEAADAAALAREYLEHREARLAQVRRAVADGATTAAEVVRVVYADVDEVLWPAAELSVRAQLDYLAAEP